jgi:energy-coupling factor transporter ATP-binding protein EcfA2
VAKGELALVLGTSGAGKSTLALNLVGIYPDFFGGWNQGRILVNHPKLGVVNRRTLDQGQRFRTVNMLFQNPEDQIVTLTVEEEVGFALENYLVPKSEIGPRIDRALDLVGLSGFRERSTLKLSGGEKQRVALASMLALEPSVLILDEPTSNLDPLGTAEVLEAVDRIRERLDITMVLIEHEVDEIFDKVDRVLLVDGHKVHGPYGPRAFLQERGLGIRDDMGLWIPQAAEVGLGLRQAAVLLEPLPLTGDELVAALPAMAAHGGPWRDGPAGPQDPQHSPQRRRTPGETVIKVRDVEFSYPSMPGVLRGVSMDIRRGELLAVVGQNGSGKSTLAAQLNGILKPTRGEVLVHAKPTTKYRFADLAKRVAYIFQLPEKQFIRNSVREEMAHGLKALKLPPAEIASRVDAYLESVRLADRHDASPYVLSQGQKRRLSVACMVIAEPDVVVLDEPTFGQDCQQAQRLMGLLRRLADEGAAVVFITHDMRLVAQYADRCVALHDGEVVFDGTPLELFDKPDVLARTRLKAPPVYHFSRQLAGEPLLDTSDLQRRIEEHARGRSGTLL